MRMQIIADKDSMKVLYDKLSKHRVDTIMIIYMDGSAINKQIRVAAYKKTLNKVIYYYLGN